MSDETRDCGCRGQCHDSYDCKYPALLAWFNELIEFLMKHKLLKFGVKAHNIIRAVDALLAERDGLKLKNDCLIAQRHMTIARLGGKVEGHPTCEIDFLQRIDELREIEKQERYWHEVAIKLGAEYDLLKKERDALRERVNLMKEEISKLAAGYQENLNKQAAEIERLKGGTQ
jgi:predicted nuclease with TOPRIM domain